MTKQLPASYGFALRVITAQQLMLTVMNSCYQELVIKLFESELDADAQARIYHFIQFVAVEATLEQELTEAYIAERNNKVTTELSEVIGAMPVDAVEELMLLCWFKVHGYPAVVGGRALTRADLSHVKVRHLDRQYWWPHYRLAIRTMLDSSQTPN